MQTAERIEQYFQAVAVTMQDLPVFNAKLQVELRDWRLVEAVGGLAVLITPWCMNLLWMPDEAHQQQWPTKGSKLSLALVSGEYECVAHQCSELGCYASASLCSPMGHFASQAEAQAMADEVIRLLYAQEVVAPVAPASSGVSRRAVLRRVMGEERP